MAYSNWTPSAVAMTPAPSAGGVMVNNRRKAFRKMVMRDGLLISTGDYAASAPPCRVVVVDVAGPGIGLRCRQPLPEGVVFSLSIPGKPEYDNSYVRIVRSRPCRGQEFEVGAEFC